MAHTCSAMYGGTGGVICVTMPAGSFGGYVDPAPWRRRYFFMNPTVPGDNRHPWPVARPWNECQDRAARLKT